METQPSYTLESMDTLYGNNGQPIPDISISYKAYTSFIELDDLGVFSGNPSIQMNLINSTKSLLFSRIEVPSTQSQVYRIENKYNNKKAILKVANDTNPYVGLSYWQPYTAEYWQRKIIEKRFSKEFGVYNIRFPKTYKVSYSASVSELVPGEHPTERDLQGFKSIIPQIQDFIGNLNHSNPWLWKNIKADLFDIFGKNFRCDNFIKSENERSLVWIDPFVKKPKRVHNILEL